MTDGEIIALYRSGMQEKAFNEIVKAYSERLYWHVRRFLCSHEDADDLLQEIFIKVWTALPSFRGEAQLFTWLYRIATNEALNYLEKNKRRSILSFRSLDPDLERKIDNDPYFNGDEVQRTLSKAIASLPERQKAVFIMRYYNELSYEQMSQVMDVSEGALKASYHIAAGKVKEYLEKNL